MHTKASQTPWGCVIGRFQPFHNDHYSLVNEAYHHHGRVVVAVTNADPTWQTSVPEAPHRHLDAANPFTFWQRHDLIAASLADTIAPQALRIVPFPMHNAALWRFYIPDDSECWVRERGPWERRKIDELSRSYRMHALPAVASDVSGSQIREMLSDDNPAWRSFVPQPAVTLIEQWQRDGSFPRASTLP
jgi:nicotinamide mononucleotide adenylyltransferase